MDQNRGHVNLDPAVSSINTPPGVLHSGYKCHSASDSDSGCALDEYTWVPPGLSPIQVSCIWVH